MQVNRYRSGTIRFVLSLSREVNEIVKRFALQRFLWKNSSKSFTTVTQTSDRIIDEAYSIERCLLYIGTRTEQRKGKVGRRNGKLKGASHSGSTRRRRRKRMVESLGIRGWKEIFIYTCNVFFFLRLRRSSYLLVWNRAPWRGIIEDGKYKEYRKPLEPKGE